MKDKIAICDFVSKNCLANQNKSVVKKNKHHNFFRKYNLKYQNLSMDDPEDNYENEPIEEAVNPIGNVDL